MGVVDWVGDTVRDVISGAVSLPEKVVDSVRDVAVDAGQWLVEAVSDGRSMVTVDGADRPMDVRELMERIRTGPGTMDWHSQAEKAQKLADGHDELSEHIRKITDGLARAWSGQAADAAQTRIQPLIAVTHTARVTFTANADRVSDTAHAFDEMKRRLEPLADTPPHRSLVDVLKPWDTDTEQALTAYNDTAQRNLRQYATYDTHASTNRESLSNDYGWINDYDGGRVALHNTGTTPSGPDTARDGQQSPPNVHDGGDVAARRDGPHPPGHTPGPVDSGGDHDDGGTLPERPAADGHDRNRAGHGSAVWPGSGEETTTAGYTPAEGRGLASAPPQPGSGPTGAVGGSIGPPTATGGAAGGLVAGVPTAGPTSGGGGSAVRGSGPGGAVGTGGPRGETGGPAVRGPAGSGATRGAGGVMGPGGIGGAGGAGRGEQDSEHTRKYGVTDDSLFDATDDSDGILTDPRTGLRAAPPTIGG